MPSLVNRVRVTEHRSVWALALEVYAIHAGNHRPVSVREVQAAQDAVLPDADAER